MTIGIEVLSADILLVRYDTMGTDRADEHLNPLYMIIYLKFYKKI